MMQACPCTQSHGPWLTPVSTAPALPYLTLLSFLLPLLLSPASAPAPAPSTCRYHLEIIKSLAAMCSEVFVGGGVQYGFTTIPTYPRQAAWLYHCSCGCCGGSE